MSVFPNGKTPETKKIVVLGTSNMHTNIYRYSYEDDKETKNNGMARVMSYVERIRKKQNIVLIDDGDTFHGTILSDAIYNKKNDIVNPVSKALNAMKYDSVTLGNHEFNFGLKFIEKFSKELNMPVLAANAYTSDGKNFQQPYTVVERDGVKIGIIGITNPNAPKWDGEKFEFNLTKTADGYKIENSNVQVVNMEKVEPSVTLRKLIKPEHEATIAL